jgi:hypothetical protein
MCRVGAFGRRCTCERLEAEIEQAYTTANTTNRQENISGAQTTISKPAPRREDRRVVMESTSRREKAGCAAVATIWPSNDRGASTKGRTKEVQKGTDLVLCRVVENAC